jgi:hypothetical protein
MSKKLSAEHRQKMSVAKLAEKNGMWKGDQVGYNQLHAWVRRRLPKPASCQKCFNGPPYDLTNITRRYTRDLTNWKYLCRKCHMWYDGRLLARDKKGKWISHKRVKVYRLLPLSPTTRIGEIK